MRFQSSVLWGRLFGMAVIWQRKLGQTRYEVRSAGRSLRLYTDGVFHSQFNPGSPVSGGVWDLLFVPALFLPPERIRRVLLLGVGGGAVIRQLQHFLAPEAIAGVELDPVHLQVARRFFRVGGQGVELYQADARGWLEGYRGTPFDLIIDDLFAGRDGEPVRSIEATAGWLGQLARRLAKGGVLTMNLPSARSLRQCGYFTSARTRERFAAAYQFTLPHYENVIGAFARNAVTLPQLHRHLQRFRELDTRRRSCRLRFRARKMG